ncbi:MAG TPA: WhiB family transcriptional regulator [Streptosporangiaceae bacterium]
MRDITTPLRPVRAGGTDWRDDAACRNLDPDLFFPISTRGAALPQIQAATRVCRRCPVRLACLRWALETGQDAGIWGGLTEEERRRLRRGPVG